MPCKNFEFYLKSVSPSSSPLGEPREQNAPLCIGERWFVPAPSCDFQFNYHIPSHGRSLKTVIAKENKHNITFTFGVLIFWGATYIGGNTVS